MGQTNESENPELILEKLKSLSINDENNFSLDKSFNTIKKILIDYKFYKDILKKNNSRKSISFIQRTKFSSTHEYSKEELLNIDGAYNKNVTQDINHKIERIKKWVKMVQFPYLKNNEINNNVNNQSNEDYLNLIINGDNMDKNNKKIKNPINLKKPKNDSNKKLILSKYTDKRIENGITEFSKNQNNKYVERVKKGPPDCFRWTSWCIINNLPLDRDNITYENYTNMVLEKENKDRILRDIQRTFSEKNIEKNELRKMETSLYKVLKAFWNLDKEVGYCQGMNLLVGFLLILSSFNERDTFYLLISNFSDTFKLRKKYEYNFRGLFSEEFPLLYFLNFIFESLLVEHANDLKNHLENMGISVDLWMGKWFQTVFTIILPINWCKRLWDNIFSENIFFMVKFGIAFTLLIKDDLMKMEEETEVLDYFKNFEKFSLCSENSQLNEKSDVYPIILKSKKYKIDVEHYIKNYEKKNENGKGFFNKMEKIEDVKYEFYGMVVSKPTMQTILFTEDENNKGTIKNSGTLKNIVIPKTNELGNNKNNEGIIFEENSKESKDISEINNKKKIINLKNGLAKKNTLTGKECLLERIAAIDIRNNEKKRTVCVNNINNQLKNNILNNNQNNNDSINNNNHENNKIINFSNNSSLIEHNNNNDNNNEHSENNNNINNSINITYDSLNNTYYQNVGENISIDTSRKNIIEHNISSHQFEKFLKNNKLDDLPFINNYFNLNNLNNELNICPSIRENNENIGIHIPKEDDISSFIGKNKFSKYKIKKENELKNDNNNNSRNKFTTNFGVIFDKEKISQLC